jgi:hypothetical protein
LGLVAAQQLQAHSLLIWFLSSFSRDGEGAMEIHETLISGNFLPWLNQGKKFPVPAGGEIFDNSDYFSSNFAVFLVHLKADEKTKK